MPRHRVAEMRQLSASALARSLLSLAAFSSCSITSIECCFAAASSVDDASDVPAVAAAATA
eukprot:COSAG06_NODE_24771_length_653_cov_0.830325_2_plen_60_part_01